MMSLYLLIALSLTNFQTSLSATCPICQKLAKVSCDEKASLCNKIAQKVCPDDVLKATHPKLPPHLIDVKDVIQRVTNPKPCSEDDDDGMMDLLGGILKVMHRSSKEDIKRARKKDLKKALSLKP